MALTTPYVPVDSDLVVVSSNHITIEGADKQVNKLENPVTRVEDYLGIGNPLIYR